MTFPSPLWVSSFSVTLSHSGCVTMLLTLGRFSLAAASCSRGAESLLAFLLKMLYERSRYTVKVNPVAPQSDPAYSTTNHPPLCPRPSTVYHSRRSVLVLPWGACWVWGATSCASVAVTFLLYLLQNPTAGYCLPVFPTVRPPFSLLSVIL